MDQFKISFDSHFISDPSFYFDTLAKELASDLKQQKLHGQYWTPRLVAGYGDAGIAYTYSGVKVNALPWTKTLTDLKALLERSIHCRFNYCLVNQYRHGRDSIGKHQDDERELAPDSPIALISLGETRTLLFSRPRFPSQRFIMTSGSLLIMYPPTNRFWFHQIPKEPTRNGVRISLTYRKILQ